MTGAPITRVREEPLAPGEHPRLTGVRVGCDVQGVGAVAEALDHFGARYLDRVYTAAEQASSRGVPASLAGRFAAKEAVLKLLGRADGIDPRSVEILPGAGGRPEIHLHDRAAALGSHSGVGSIDVSISHDTDADTALAVAVAVVLAPPVPSHPTTPCGENP